MDYNNRWVPAREGLANAALATCQRVPARGRDRTHLPWGGPRAPQRPAAGPAPSEAILSSEKIGPSPPEADELQYVGLL